MSVIKLSLKDLGGVPLVYDTSLVEIMQDPAWVAAYARPGYLPNVYGPADVFRAPDGRTVDYHEALAMALSQSDLARAISQQQTARPSATTVPGSTTTASSAADTPAVSAARATETTMDQVVKFLKRPIWPDDPHSVSTGIVLGGLVLVWYLMSGKKRR
ncbi:MAG: hypothetical protein ACM3US_07275 [Sphingomonadaceae bacterium]